MEAKAAVVADVLAAMLTEEAAKVDAQAEVASLVVEAAAASVGLSL